MASVARIAVMMLIVAALGGSACGDGKFFVREKVPADVPYQRAFLYFGDGNETLLLQSKYAVPASSQIDSLAWVVPVPAVPEIASIDPVMADLFFYRTVLLTQPDPLHISDMIAFASVFSFLGGVVLLLVCLIEYPFIRWLNLSRAAWELQGRIAVIVTVISFLVAVALGMPHRRTAAGGHVEVVKAERAGIYEVQVIRGDSGDAVTDWLKDNGFAFGKADVDVCQSYVDRGWCFVTAKVGPDALVTDSKIATEGMVAPLILKFGTAKPVYPLALTAAAGSVTEILIYTLTENKLGCGQRLTLRAATQTDLSDAISQLVSAQGESQSTNLFGDVLAGRMMLCKFKSRLTPAQMKQDLEFDAAPDDAPYRERRIVW